MTKEEQARLQKEHEAKYMKYMADFESFGGDFSLQRQLQLLQQHLRQQEPEED